MYSLNFKDAAGLEEAQLKFLIYNTFVYNNFLSREPRLPSQIYRHWFMENENIALLLA